MRLGETEQDYYVNGPELDRNASNSTVGTEGAGR
jgi:hypothetical protein